MDELTYMLQSEQEALELRWEAAQDKSDVSIKALMRLTDEDIEDLFSLDL